MDLRTVLFVLYITNRLVFITEVQSVYCAVRKESLYKAESFVLKGYVTEMPVQAWTGHYGSRRLRLEELLDNLHKYAVRLSAIRIGLPISVTGWVDPEATVRSERLSQWRIPMTPSGIEPAISRLVGQSPNQMRHTIFNPLKSGG